MERKEKQDWSELFPAHIHAAGEEAEQGEYSLIRLNMLDYSSENQIKVYANMSPEEAIYIYSALFCHLLGFEFSQEKIFGIPDTNANGGKHCRKGSYIRAFEMENAFRQNWVGNFENLYRLLQKNMDELRKRQEKIFSGLWPEGRKAA